VKETMTTPFAGTPMAQQVENALLQTWAAWGLSTPQEQEQSADQLEALVAQLAALQAKVKELESQIAQQKETQRKDEADKGD
jgi:cell division protein FtsB